MIEKNLSMLVGIGTVLLGLLFWLGVAYRSVRARRLPFRYCAYGLFLISGVLYVVTLDKRYVDADSFRARVADRLAEWEWALTGVSILMAMAIVQGVGGAAWCLHLALSSRTAATAFPVEAIPFVLVLPINFASGIFHFTVTRKRLQALLELVEYEE